MENWEINKFRVARARENGEAKRKTAHFSHCCASWRRKTGAPRKTVAAPRFARAWSGAKGPDRSRDRGPRDHRDAESLDRGQQREARKHKSMRRLGRAAYFVPRPIFDRDATGLIQAHQIRRAHKRATPGPRVATQPATQSRIGKRAAIFALQPEEKTSSKWQYKTRLRPFWRDFVMGIPLRGA